MDRTCGHATGSYDHYLCERCSLMPAPFRDCRREQRLDGQISQRFWVVTGRRLSGQDPEPGLLMAPDATGNYAPCRSVLGSRPSQQSHQERPDTATTTCACGACAWPACGSEVLMSSGETLCESCRDGQHA